MEILQGAINLIRQHDWLIEPKAFRAIIDSLTLSSTETVQAQRTIKDVTITEKVAVLPVNGVLMKNIDLLSFLLGATSTDTIKTTLSSLVNDPSVSAIVLDINSPGGTVHGTAELAEYVYKSRGSKPILAHTSTMAASAAYWIASAADMVTALDSADVGSIGVYMEHLDYSKYLENEGIKPTIISAGRNKTAGIYGYPLTEKDRDLLQSRVNEIYDLFVSSVSRNRGLSKDRIVNEIGGEVYLAERAQSLGLVDKIMTLEETVRAAGQIAYNAKAEKMMISAGINALSCKLSALKAKYL